MSIEEDEDELDDVSNDDEDDEEDHEEKDEPLDPVAQSELPPPPPPLPPPEELEATNHGSPRCHPSSVVRQRNTFAMPPITPTIAHMKYAPPMSYAQGS